MQMKSTVIVSGLFIFLMWYFHSAYVVGLVAPTDLSTLPPRPAHAVSFLCSFAGVVVARLPFEPLGLIQGAND